MKILTSIDDAVPPRPTLKLKTGARVSEKERKPSQVSPQPTHGKSKPGAHWSDEYKQRMQEEMDKLVR